MRPETSALASPEEIDTAAVWLAHHWHVAPQPFTRTLRQQFGLGFVDAAKAYAQAERILKASEAANGK